MAKAIKVRGLKALRNKLKSKFKIIINRTLRDKALRLKIGRIIEKDIRDNFNEPAGEITQAFREYLEQFNSTHPDYRRSKINITFTGELLEDLANNVKADTVNLAFIVEHSNKKHKIYKSGGLFKAKKVQVTSLKSKKTTNRTVKQTHKEISGHIQKLGYDYLKVTNSAEREIILLLKQVILDNINREFGA